MFPILFCFPWDFFNISIFPWQLNILFSLLKNTLFYILIKQIKFFPVGNTTFSHTQSELGDLNKNIQNKYGLCYNILAIGNLASGHII